MTGERHATHEAILDSLRRHARGYAEYLFGPPTTGRLLRAKGGGWQLEYPGNNFVVVDGPNLGGWNCWTSGGNGGLLHATEQQHSCARGEAWRIASAWSAIPLDGSSLPSPAERRVWRETRDAERTKARATGAAQEAAQLDAARQTWAATVPIDGTLGATYLRDTRGIPTPEGGWPAVLRWHPGYRAIVALATDDAGELRAVHRIHLDSAGRNVVIPAGKNGKSRKKKLTDGPRRGALVRLPAFGPAAGTVLRGEGVETGLSGWRATGYETQIVLGALAQTEPVPGRRTILLADDDAPGSTAAAAVDAAQTKWRERGLTFAMATPWAEPRGDKSDFNDVLQAGGLAAVVARIREAVLALDGLQATEGGPVPTQTIEAVRQHQTRDLYDFLMRRIPAEGQPAPAWLVDGATGTGKTETILTMLPDVVYFDKAKRRPSRVAYLTPTGRHAAEIAERNAEISAAADHPLRSAIVRGRGELTCQAMPAVGLALRAGADVKDAVCGAATKLDQQCEHRTSCGYFRQLDPARDADLMILPHDYLTRELPDTRLGDNIGLVVIDEDPTPALTSTVTVPRAMLNAAASTSVLTDGQFDDEATTDLEDLYRRMREALAALATGVPLPQGLREAALTRTALLRAKDLTWRRKVTPDMTPAMSLAARRSVMREVEANHGLPLIASLIKAMLAVVPDDAAPEFDLTAPAGRIRIEGDDAIVIEDKPIARWLRDKPVVILSATADPTVLRRFFANLEAPHQPLPAMPHVTIHQHLTGTGKRALRGKIEDVALWMRLEAAGRPALLVNQLAQDERLRELLPNNFVSLHHGDVAGDNRFGHVELQFIIGAPTMAPQDTADRASAAAGFIVPAKSLEMVPARVTFPDGTGAAYERPGYRDPLLHAAHRHVHDGALNQAIGRGRGVNRTASNPLITHIIGYGEQAYPVDTISLWRRPDRVMRMADAGIIATNAAAMLAQHPDQFSSYEAAEKYLARSGGAAGIEARARQIVAGLPEPWVRATVQPQGQGYRKRDYFVATRKIDELRDSLGPLALFEVRRFTAGRRTPGHRLLDIFQDMSGSLQADHPLTGFDTQKPASRPPRAPPDG